MSELLKPIHTFVSGEYKWIPGDTEERWQYNLENNKKNLQRYGWLDRTFTYHTDSFGFRNRDDFNNKTEYSIFLGCSHTFGIGLPEEDTWVYKVANAIGSTAYNAGYPGGSLDTCFRILLALNGKIKFKNIFVFVPDDYRFECFNRATDDFEMITAWQNKHLLRYFSANKSIQVSQQKNLLAIEQICNLNNANLYYLIDRGLEIEQGARDLSHYSSDSHTQIAEKFIDQYRKKQSK